MIIEVQVRVVLPVERAEPPQRAVGHALTKGLAKLGGRSSGITESGHELSLAYALGELE